MLLNDGVPSASYDCIVVGSGPAGLSLAFALGSANKRVLIIESGGESPVRELANAIGYGHYADDYWNHHSVKALGGSSQVWAGWVTTLSDRTFDNPSVGVRWPITRQDLVPYYRKAAALIDRDASIVDFERGFFPGFHYRPFSRGVPTRFDSKYGDQLRVSPAIDVLLGCSTVGLDANDSRRAISVIRYFHHASGVTRDLAITPSQSVVLAAGGIGNAQLLLQPRKDGTVSAGNESGQAGRFIMEHPHFYGVAECVLDDDLDRHLPTAAFGPAEHALVVDTEHSEKHGLFECSLQFHEKTTDHELVRHLSSELGKPFYHYTINARAEMLPSAANRVFLTGERDRSGLYRPGVRCVLDARDLLNTEMTLRFLGESLIGLRKGRVRIDNARLYGQPNGGGHIMGTTRMGNSRSTSVVDRNCRVHGYDNLYVAGSSVFPTGGYANPTFTIVALALRLADTLVNRG
ncbi:MAG: GMC family oxidoreductase [Vicinamibacterales bacterium]